MYFLFNSKLNGRKLEFNTPLIQPFKIAVLSRNLDQNMLKNALFEKKAVKSQQRPGFPNPVSLRRLFLQNPAFLFSLNYCCSFHRVRF